MPARTRFIHTILRPSGKVIVPRPQEIGMSESAPGRASSDSSPSDKGVSCPECGKSYSGNSGLAYHMRRCCPDEMVECDICSKLLISEEGIRNHEAQVHDLGKVAKQCLCCGEEFKVKRHREDTAKYCSPSCRTRDTVAGWNEKEHPQLVCEGCGNTYTVPPHAEESSRFCSTECRLSESVTLECSLCGEEYQEKIYESDGSKYCSLSCKAEAFKTRFSGEDSPRWRGGSVRYYGPNWREQRRRARIRDQSRCQYCGTTPLDTGEELAVHHIHPIRKIKDKYDPPEWYERANRLDNLVCLCRSCHHKWEGATLRPQLVFDY